MTPILYGLLGLVIFFSIPFVIGTVFQVIYYKVLIHFFGKDIKDILERLKK